VTIAAELAQRNLTVTDFTVIRPSLQDAVVSLISEGQR
jgi:hypothetical protein